MSLIIIALIGVLTVGVFSYTSRNKNTDSATKPSTVQEANTTAATNIPAVQAAMYKDGEYRATGAYTSPGGEETVGVTVTLKNDVIEDAVFEPQAEIPASVKFQGIFAENYKQFVVGKKIDEVKLDKVAGSSLTPKGFNNAIEQIKNEAKS